MKTVSVLVVVSAIALSGCSSLPQLTDDEPVAKLTDDVWAMRREDVQMLAKEYIFWKTRSEALSKQISDIKEAYDNGQLCRGIRSGS